MEEMEQRGVKPLSIEEQMTMKVIHGMSFFSQREAFMKAAEEGKNIEYVQPEEQKERKLEESNKAPKFESRHTVMPGKQKELQTEEEKKVINIRSTTFRPMAKSESPHKEHQPEENVVEGSNLGAKKEYNVNGFKIPKSVLLAQKNLCVVVDDPTWHDDGFFSTNYVTYQIRTPDMGYTVRRKDKD